MKTAFGIPHGGNNFVYPYVNSAIGLCLYEASKKPEDRLLGSILPAGGPYVDDNRTSISINLVTQTQDDWVLMVDPDIEFTHTILETHKKYVDAYPEAKIIAGRVNLLNGLPVFYEVKETAIRNRHYYYPFEGLKEFDLVGTGIIFIHKDVFIKIREVEGHHHFFHRVLTPKTDKSPMGQMLYGDDFSFCARAKNAGFKLYGAWDIVGIHHKIYPVPQRYPEIEGMEIKLK